MPTPSTSSQPSSPASNREAQAPADRALWQPPNRREQLEQARLLLASPSFRQWRQQVAALADSALSDLLDGDSSEREYARGKVAAYRELLGTGLRDRFLQDEGLDVTDRSVHTEGSSYMPTDLGPLELEPTDEE